MNQLVTMLKAVQDRKRPPLLIASLPRNDAALARAAVSGGADVLKVHLNVHHQAGGVRFGSLKEENQNLDQIFDIAEELPVGVVPAGNAEISAEELEEIAARRFDFLSIYDHHAPIAKLPDRERISRMIALSCHDDRFIAAQFPRLPIDVVELSVMAHESYGQPFTYRDLAFVRDLAECVAPLPTVLPTQHAILPNMVKEIADAGVCAIMIGVIVAGSTPQSWEKACREFRAALDESFRA